MVLLTICEAKLCHYENIYVPFLGRLQIKYVIPRNICKPYTT